MIAASAVGSNPRIDPRAQTEKSDLARFSLDGQSAWSHTPGAYNACTKEPVAFLKDQNNQLFASSKFLEVQFPS